MAWCPIILHQPLTQAGPLRFNKRIHINMNDVRTKYSARASDEIEEMSILPARRLSSNRIQETDQQEFDADLVPNFTSSLNTTNPGPS